MSMLWYYDFSYALLLLCYFSFCYIFSLDHHMMPAAPVTFNILKGNFYFICFSWNKNKKKIEKDLLKNVSSQNIQTHTQEIIWLN